METYHKIDKVKLDRILKKTFLGKQIGHSQYYHHPTVYMLNDIKQVQNIVTSSKNILTIIDIKDGKFVLKTNDDFITTHGISDEGNQNYTLLCMLVNNDIECELAMVSSEFSLNEYEWCINVLVKSFMLDGELITINSHTYYDELLPAVDNYICKRSLLENISLDDKNSNRKRKM